MTETPSDDGESAVARVRADLAERMRAYGWPVSFGAGVTTCSGVGCTVER